MIVVVAEAKEKNKNGGKLVVDGEDNETSKQLIKFVLFLCNKLAIMFRKIICSLPSPHDVTAG